MISQIDVIELKKKLDSHENFVLVDVRQPDEHATAKIEGSKLIPLSTFAQEAVKVLKKDDAVVIHCHHGGRSQKACEYLKSIGYTNVSNVAGGIDAWSLQIDSKVPRY